MFLICAFAQEVQETGLLRASRWPGFPRLTASGHRTEKYPVHTSELHRHSDMYPFRLLTLVSKIKRIILVLFIILEAYTFFSILGDNLGSRQEAGFRTHKQGLPWKQPCSLHQWISVPPTLARLSYLAAISPFTPTSPALNHLGSSVFPKPQPSCLHEAPTLFLTLPWTSVTLMRGQPRDQKRGSRTAGSCLTHSD